MKSLSLSLIVCLLLVSANAQNIDRYQFKEYKWALENQTRSLDGSPGVNYWQNTANYTIEAELFPKENLLKGKATIKYMNNSPDTVRNLVFNLYQDIYRSGNSRDWDIGTDDLHGGTKITRMIIDGVEMDPANRRQMRTQGTKLVVAATTLPAVEKTIKIDWEVPIPSTRTVRMGRYGDSVFFVAYWYPQMAVYDDMDGWDMISYGGSVEFYNEFGDIDVRMTLPADYVMWATGLLQNAEEVFHPNIAKRYQDALESDEVVSIITQADYKKGQVSRSKKKNSWHFSAESLPDFSFAAAIGFNWDAVSLVVDKKSGRRTLTDAVYPHGAIHYEKVAEFARHSIQYLSEVIPGIPFPYPQMTNFCNGRPSGGMETPMMANNSAPNEESDIFGLTFHEIAHTYFPFAMGTNEKKYAWMDEGWATLWPHVLVDSLYPDRRYIERTMGTYQNNAGVEMDVPPMVPNQLLGADYASLRLASYVRPAVAFHFLEDALGTELFVAALQTFMAVWEGKHPIPHDFYNTFERVAGEGLNWFFKPWFFETAYPDLAIHKVTNDRRVVVRNDGGLPLPVQLTFTLVDDSVYEIYHNGAIWKTGDKQIAINIPGDLPVKEIKLGSPRIPDVNQRNNTLHLID